MSRKELILVAVLINTGLLITLFVTALKPSSALEREGMYLAKEEKVDQVPAVVEKPQKNVDVVDNLLSQYVKEETKAEGEKSSKQNEMLSLESKQTKVSEGQSTVQTPSKVKEVIVRKGDVLEKIARNHKTSVEEIMHLNQMHDTKLRIGQILYVPENGSGSYTAPPKKRPAEQIDQERYYIVKNGDSPWTIAIKNHIKVEELLRLNNLDESKAKKLKPGDRLRIR